MRVTVGAIAVLGMAVTVAAAQPPRERAAVLMPPQPVAPGDLPLVARGAVDDFPSAPYLSSSPVQRTNRLSTPGVSSGPAWLNGSDPNVQPAGFGGYSGAAQAVTPASGPTGDAPPVPPRFIDRIRMPGSSDKQPAKQAPAAAQTPEQPTASTPFRGTGANGAPVYAGPPAYRWYGWGTVTPGANALAPAGQYPKASANWYAITGATPGAFPVPVANPARTTPGTEPPTYGLAARAQPSPPPSVPVVVQVQPAAPFNDHPEASKFAPPESKFAPPESKFGPAPESKFMPSSIGAAPPAPPFNPPPTMPVSVPTLTPPPMPKPVAVAPPAPFLPPAPVTAPVAVTAAPAVAIPTLPKPDPILALPLPPLPLPSMAPVPAVEPAKVVGSEPKPLHTMPAPLPSTIAVEPARSELQWQQSPEPTTPQPGTWAPAPGSKPLPTLPAEPRPGEQTGRAQVGPGVARGQMGDKTPDPVATLIQQVCQGRAEGVEVRWTGTKKLSVCFEIRTAPAAQKLVADISRRPELTAYQIDFCVVVK